MRYIVYKKGDIVATCRDWVEVRRGEIVKMGDSISLDAQVGDSDCISVEVSPNVWLNFGTSEWASVILQESPEPRDG